MTRSREIRPTSLRRTLAEPYGMALALAAARQCTRAKLDGEDGTTRIGEAWGPPAGVRGYSVDNKNVCTGRNLFAHARPLPALLGRNDPFGIENQMLALTSGIDSAAFNAIGKRLGLPVHALIGGKARQSAAVYASGGYMTVDPRTRLDAMPERFLARGGGLLSRRR